MKKLILTLFTSCLLLTKIDALIVNTPNLENFEKALLNADQQTFVLFDVDETILLPKDLILQPLAKSAWNQLSKEILENPTVVPSGKYDSEYFLSKVFSKMDYEIVDPKIIGIIHNLQSKNIKTIAFTKMPAGRFGTIPSMEDWRLEHLKKYNIDFSAAFPQFPKLVITIDESSDRCSVFKQGLLFANKHKKGPVFTAFIESIKWKPEKVFLIDNRLDYLQSVEESLEGSGIEFVGFHYTDVEDRPFVINIELAKFQIMHLAKTGIWLSDIEALELME